jgi:hypothetical protein
MAKKLIIFAAVAVVAVSACCLCSLYEPKEVHYRPMCYFSDRLFVDEFQNYEINTEETEFLLRINSCVGISNVPKNNGECNYPNMLGAEIYTDGYNYYMKYPNGNTVKIRALK